MKADHGKIVLRNVEPADAQLMFLWENEVEYQTPGIENPKYSLDEIIEFTAPSYQDIYLNKQLRLIIENKVNLQTVGYVDLYDVDFEKRNSGVGILISREFRNQGFATDAVAALVGYAFRILCLYNLYCMIQNDNIYSIRLFEKTGFIKKEIPDYLKYNSELSEKTIYLQISNPDLI